MTEFFCIVWLLTSTCTDDLLKWSNPEPDPPVAIHVRLVYGGSTVEIAPGSTWFGVGCFDGTIRLTTVNDETGVESENPFFFRWEGIAGEDTLGAEATGRFMYWGFPLQTGLVDEFRCGT